MLRLSIDTMYLLHAENDLDALEAIHDFHFYEMEEEKRFGFFFDAETNEIKVHPVPAMKKEKSMTDKKTEPKKTSKMILDLLNVLTPTLVAIKAYIRHFAKD